MILTMTDIILIALSTVTIMGLISLLVGFLSSKIITQNEKTLDGLLREIEKVTGRQVKIVNGASKSNNGMH